MMKSIIGAGLLALAVSLGSAYAQAPSSKPAMTPEEKKAISTSCSQQADAKGLHGKARHKFRSACKRHGGKAT
ncbi:MAG TPA: PsiF family protein [Xanthobacteraceae bacterium]|nr:PsiF family protein [Xanthobacteraceae bacterium]